MTGPQSGTNNGLDAAVTVVPELWSSLQSILVQAIQATTATIWFDGAYEWVVSVAQSLGKLSPTCSSASELGAQ